jgi:predicted nucleotidyltransferase
MPKVLEIYPLINTIVNKLTPLPGVEDVYIWGSAAKHWKDPNTRIKDIDILIKSNVFSEDLLSIDEKIIKETKTSKELEKEGFESSAIKFSQDIVKFKNILDIWVISKDDKLLHWGPIFNSKQEHKEVSKDAEYYAYKKTGMSKKKLDVASQEKRKNWYNTYIRYIDRQFSDIPSGWFQSDEDNILNIINDSIKISN